MSGRWALCKYFLSTFYLQGYIPYAFFLLFFIFRIFFYVFIFIYDLFFWGHSLEKIHGPFTHENILGWFPINHHWMLPHWTIRDSAWGYFASTTHIIHTYHWWEKLCLCFHLRKTKCTWFLPLFSRITYSFPIIQCEVETIAQFCFLEPM